LELKTIIYDPQLGQVWPDCAIQDAVDKWFRDPKKPMIQVSNELFCHYARAFICQHHQEGFKLEFHYNGETLTVNDAGRLDKWPPGFCDHFDRYLDILIRMPTMEQECPLCGCIFKGSKGTLCPSCSGKGC
jgi:hypothetical protein